MKIYVVDCYHSDAEVAEVQRIAASHGAEVLCLPNVGYGAALNAGLDRALAGDHLSEDGMVFFGNCDVVPTHRIEANEALPDIPMPIIHTGRKSENPLLTRAQERFLFVSELSAKLNSKILFFTWVTLKKIISYFFNRSPAVAVHGSLFCAKVSKIRDIHPIFEESVFLYCEELFFMRKLKSTGARLQYVNLKFSHEGSVSTGKYVKQSFDGFFKVWRQSMRVYSAGKRVSGV